MRAILNARLVLFNLVLIVSISAQAAVPTGVSRYNVVPAEVSQVFGKRLTDIASTRLLPATKAENIHALLGHAQRDRQLDHIDALRYARLYNSIDGGDALLLACLQKPACQLHDFSRNATASQLHREVIRRDPSLGWVQANHAVGTLSERVMHRFFVSSGWEALPGELGRQGIDGLFVKRRGNLVSDVLVIESKYNTSALQDTLSGTQMSDAWVRAKVAALAAGFPDNPDYMQVKEIVEAGGYRGILWKLGISDDAVVVSLQRVISRDTTVALEPLRTQNSLVSPLGPLDSPDSAELGHPLQNMLQKWMQEEIDLMFPDAEAR